MEPEENRRSQKRPIIGDFAPRGFRHVSGNAGISNTTGGSGLDWIISRSRHDLLEPSEEIELGRIIQRGIAAEAHLAGKSDQAEWIELRQSVDAGRSAQEFMVLHNLRLVMDIAMKFRGRGLEIEDLFQEGYFGLLRAVEKFDPTLGLRFSTYATWWIRQRLQRAIANLASLVRLPVHVHDKVAKVMREQGRLIAIKGWASSDDIADATGLSFDDVEFAMSLARRTASLDAPLGGGLATLGDFLVDESEPSTERLAEKVAVAEAVRRALDGLDPRSADVVVMRFGLDGRPPQTLQEVGEGLGLTRERIRQIESAALSQLGILLDDEWNPGD